ncbi:MAG: MG2 domain-containing protein, partial [Bacteroidales bacterium]|nr:MG2 domain-containing protein [Bacteroidales bacterium]
MNRIIFFSAVILAVIVISCGRSQKEQESRGTVPPVTIIDKGFSKYISAYTSGIISSGSTVQIVFTPEFAASIDRNKTQGLFTFDPSIKGTTEWADDLTLLFRPAKPLQPATNYEGTLDISRLGTVEERFRFFPLSFSTIEKNFTVTLNPVSADLPDGETYTLTGVLVTSDYTDPAEVEKYLTAGAGKRDEKIVWEHDSNNNHTFTVEKIARQSEESELKVAWNGNPYGIKAKGEIAVTIPAKGKFTVTDLKVSAGDSKSVEIFFSDLIDPEFEPEGVVTMRPSHPLTVTAEGNRMLIIPGDYVIGETEITIDGALRNTRGEKLGEPVTRGINFTPVMPGIKAVGKGTIMPSSGSLIFPFMAANLSAVDLTIIKIFENNLPWFLQQNSMGEANVYNDVKRFGRPVYRGRISLTGDAGFDPNRYNLFTIDLANYIDPEPGILYRIELGMWPSYSLYPCSSKPEKSKYEEMLDLADLDREWEGSDNYYQFSEEGLFYEYAYDWRERENPCREAYYSPYKKLVRNILASDLGIMVKNGTDNNLRIFVNDLQTAQPVEGATAEIFDYQMQLIGTAVTDRYGVAALPCTRKPSLVIVRKESNRNYLSLNDGAALSMSSFDVSGEMPQEGIRAFIFTERDVRRPGDTIFVGLIVKDVASSLPAGHPVHFELINPMGQRVDDQVAALNDQGFITFTTLTSADAVTGNYRAQVRIGGASFSKTIKVETVKPNRLRIKLDFPYAVAGGESRAVRGDMKVSWLNGTVARDLKTTVDLLLKPVKTTFERYGQYNFDDPVARFWFESQTIFDGSINSSGEAVVSFTPDDELNAP